MANGYHAIFLASVPATGALRPACAPTSAGWQSLDPRFFNNNTLDRGISGQTSAQLLVRFRADVLDLQSVLVHIMAGTNDIAGNTGATSLAAIHGNIASLVELDDWLRGYAARAIAAGLRAHHN